MRIVSNPRYSNPQPIQLVFDSLTSLLDSPVDTTRVQSSGQVTDTSLLALALTHQALLATFDKKLVTTAVTAGGKSIVHIR